jgi:hypothetical protein
VQETPTALAATLDEEPARILACLYTRHHDGHVRPRAVHDIIASENDQFLHLTRQHIIGYWTCYYRSVYSLAAYPPVEVMTRLDLWKGHDARRRLSRPATGGA